MGFTNPQAETNRFSLRYELFRGLPDDEGKPFWREKLWECYVPDLWDIAEVRRYCVPPEGVSAEEPALVIPFSSTIQEGLNFFGNEASGRDSTYDSTQFATKIRSVGVWFSNYDVLSLSNTPRVYLVPVGIDVMRSPTAFTGKLREFRVVDQLLPVPFPIGEDELNSSSWIPSVDTTGGQFVRIRRYGRLRAYHDSGEFNIDEVDRDSRLVGRSVWNTRWLLIIPGSTFLNDATEGLTRFIEGSPIGEDEDGHTLWDGQGVSDILLFFETYAYPRLKKENGPSVTLPAEVVQGSETLTSQ